MVFPEYGSDRDFVWAEQVCSWCTGCPRHERVEECLLDGCDSAVPCSEECSRDAVRAARTRRLEGAVEALKKAMRLRAVYVAEAIPGDRRLPPLATRIAELDALIGELVARQVREDRERADTVPALEVAS